METFKLISMTYFVLECDTLEKAQNYAKFLKQPLTLGMFVPCSEDGDVLIESFSEKYKEAKERVLFKGRFIENLVKKYLEGSPWAVVTINELTDGISDVEELKRQLAEVELTETAIRQLGL